MVHNVTELQHGSYKYTLMHFWLTLVRLSHDSGSGPTR